jgi:hypothetical protein
MPARVCVVAKDASASLFAAKAKAIGKRFESFANRHLLEVCGYQYILPTSCEQPTSEETPSLPFLPPVPPPSLSHATRFP